MHWSTALLCWEPKTTTSFWRHPQPKKTQPRLKSRLRICCHSFLEATTCNHVSLSFHHCLQWRSLNSPWNSLKSKIPQIESLWFYTSSTSRTLLRRYDWFLDEPPCILAQPEVFPDPNTTAKSDGAGLLLRCVHLAMLWRFPWSRSPVGFTFSLTRNRVFLY